jgi:leucyl/phenylalanyl-tRNA--protein transferase
VDSRDELPGAWLGQEMIKAYTELYRRERAMSVEVWETNISDGSRTLVGGLYGVLSGSVFCGESMFSKTPSASKLALITLAQRLQRIPQKTLIDCQFETPHLRSMGGRHISYAEYMDIMNTNNT